MIDKLALGGMFVLVAGAGLAAWDLRSQQAGTVVVYTTPALRDLLEKDVVPRFEAATGHPVALVYVAAGQQYNRLRLSGQHPEADLFLHASPLYLERGAADGFMEPIRVTSDASIPERFKAAPDAQGGHAWVAFAWSPLVEVYKPGLGAAPDLATFEVPFGFAHPLLSNNGAYTALFFESVAPEAGRHALQQTRVQPVNARANLGGIVDGSFDVTLGYEAVTLFYRSQGAPVAYDLPLVAGERYATPVLCSVALVREHPHAAAEALLEFLFTNETQRRVGTFGFRPVVQGAPEPPGLLPLDDAHAVDFDWSQWRALDAALPRYVVT